MMRVSLAVAALLSGLGVASADPVTQKRADDLFSEGRKLIEKHEDAAACAKFDEAIKLDPGAAGTMLNLGLCNQNLHKYRLALYWFRKAQARAHETNLPEYEQAAGQRTQLLAAQISIVKVQLAATTPPDAVVRIDGEQIPAADYLHVEIDEGQHTLDARAPGHRSSHSEFDVVGKGGETLTVDLVAGDEFVDRGAGQRKVAVVTAIGGGALLLTSGALALLAHHNYVKCTSGSTFTPGDSACPGDNAEAKRQYANDQYTLARYWGTSLFIGGAVAVGVATYLYLTAPDKERLDQTAIVPTLSPDGAGLAAVGRF
jgi:tetratricopeptide (TPR) repeat protein